jgi:threonine aldolase
MRQAGIIAAAGIFALSNNVDRLVEDHENAVILANGLFGLDEIHIDPEMVQTNMVFATLKKGKVEEFAAFLKNEGVLINIRTPIRLVTHLDVSTDDIHRVISLFKTYFNR